MVFGAVFHFGFKLNPHAYFHADSANKSRFRGSKGRRQLAIKGKDRPISLAKSAV
jgi:hypothetical protein